MNDFIYEDIEVNKGGRNMSLGIFMKTKVAASENGRVEIYESDAFGRCLYLDGALQTTERDEHLYHETLVHATLFSVAVPRRVLIIGGGDGGSLREVLKHKVRGLERVVMCEINPDVVELCKEHFPSTELKENLTDSCVQLVIEDGVKFLKSNEAKFDAIIVDCNDPTPESSPLYSREFLYEVVRSHVAEAGIFAIQAGNFFIKEQFVRRLKYELKRGWRKCKYFYAPIPSYPSGGIGFLIASNAAVFNYASGHKVDTRYASADALLGSAMICPVQNRRVQAFEWYCKNHFDFRSNLTRNERNVLERFFLLDGEPYDLDAGLPLMSFFYAKNKGYATHTVHFLTNDGCERIDDAVHLLLEERNISKLPFPIAGFSLDSNLNSACVHYYISREEALRSNLYDLNYSEFPESVFDKVLLTQTAFKGGYTLAATYSNLAYDLTYRTYEKSLSEMKRVRTNEGYWKGQVDESGRALIEGGIAQGMKFDRIARLTQNNFVVSLTV